MGREGGRREEGGGAQQRRRLADRSPPPTVGTVFSLRSEAEEGNRLPSCWTLMVHTAAARPLGTAGGLIPRLPGPLRSASRCTKLRTRARSPRPGLPGPRPPPGGSRASRQPLPHPPTRLFALPQPSRLGFPTRGPTSLLLTGPARCGAGPASGRRHVALQEPPYVDAPTAASPQGACSALSPHRPALRAGPRRRPAAQSAQLAAKPA